MVRKRIGYSLNERIARAHRLRQEGYNCTQCVTMVFDDIKSVPSEAMAGLSCGFGSGFSALGMTCGVFSGMTILEGLHLWHEPLSKPHVYRSVRMIADNFCDKFGSLICNEIKGEGKVPCIDLIDYAVTEMHERFLHEDI